MVSERLVSNCPASRVQELLTLSPGLVCEQPMSWTVKALQD